MAAEQRPQAEGVLGEEVGGRDLEAQPLQRHGGESGAAGNVEHGLEASGPAPLREVDLAQLKAVSRVWASSVYNGSG